MTFWVASGFFWHGIASFIKIMIKQSNNKARCYHILVFTVLKEQRMASSQKIHKGRCFTFLKGQRDSCLLSELNLPVLYIPCNVWFRNRTKLIVVGCVNWEVNKNILLWVDTFQKGLAYLFDLSWVNVTTKNLYWDSWAP